MNVYVESNFVLQLALRQEFHASCEAILQSCESGGAQLVVPAICLAEPDQTLYRQKQRRTQIKADLDKEFRQLARTAVYSGRSADIKSCFLNADKDFDDPDLVAELTAHNCKLIASFDDGRQYVDRFRS